MQSIQSVRKLDPWYYLPEPDFKSCSWLETPEGEVLRYMHPIVEDGASTVDRSLPVTVVNGAREGPLLLLLAGEHGNEYENIVALQDHLIDLELGVMKGRVVAITCCSVDSYQNNIRVSHEDGQNLARCYPGRRNGCLTERVAWTLQHDFLGHRGRDKPDLMIALHTFGPDMIGPTMCGYNIYRESSVLNHAEREASLATGFEVIWGHEFDPTHAAKSEIGVDDSGRTALYAAFLAGVPAIYWETTWGMGGEDEYRHGLLRIMKHLGMLEGENDLLSSRRHIVTMGHGSGNLASHNRTPVNGLWVPIVGIWDEVKEGDVLGVVRDLFGRTLQEIRSQRGGVVIGLPKMQYIREGMQCGVVV